MNRQQAPQPVVRPLPVIRTGEALRDFVLTRPATEDGTHMAYCVAPSFLIETSEGNVTPLVELWVYDNYICLYLQYCGDGDKSAKLVDATGVNRLVLCDDIPCATGDVSLTDALNFVNGIAYAMATDGYEIDEIAWGNRSTLIGKQVDALIDFD